MRTSTCWKEDGGQYYWDLDRPKSRLPNSYFWTWDHSCNWVLDDPGTQNFGCYNKYFKKPETYVEDYRRLTNVAAGLGIKGIVIYGFLRDSHGGVEHAKRVADYGASKGRDILPGLGVTWYGGVYYEGSHKYSLPNFLAKNPDARMLQEDGTPKVFNGEHGACLAHPAFREWLAEAVNWLYDEFAIGGVNLENGDMLVDYHPLVKQLREEAGWPAEDPEQFFHQGMAYKLALDAIGERVGSSVAGYATYTGFNYGDELVQDTSSMGKTPPAMLKVLPEDAVCQWTLTGMVRGDPLPLTAYLDDGAPQAAFDSERWPANLKPLSKRSIGFMHQGSQWRRSRYDCIVSSIKEACLRAYRAGFEGVGIHGEVSSRCIPYALNYLAFSHFTHYPEDSMREFGRKTLGQVLGSEKDGEDYAEVLSHWHAGTLTDDMKACAAPAHHGFRAAVCGSCCDSVDEAQRFNFWWWLHCMANAGSHCKGAGALML